MSREEAIEIMEELYTMLELSFMDDSQYEEAVEAIMAGRR